ncbi:MAG: hypothetical protein MSC31_18155 [Solirubrobacteraceae bacterium MAG38_C4-C5]|nr:hypothetical protein [Candidatus Siliceabacter maunaloa]
MCDTELCAERLPRHFSGRERSRLVHYVVQLVGDPAVAERLVCEILAAWSPQPAGAPSLRAALYRQAHRRVVDHPDRRATDLPRRADRALNRRAQLLDDLQTLPLEQRAALLLRTAGDLSHEEIAHVLDLGAAQTRDVLVKARVALAEAGQMS